VNPHHRCVLTELLSQIDSLDEAIARVDAHIQAICGPVDEAVALLDTVPGVARRTAAMLAAEIGKRASGKTRKGHRFLRTTLVQAAHAAARARGTYLSARYRRLAARRGKKRAILAVAHAMLVMAYDMIRRRGPCRDAGADCFDRLQPEETARRPVKRLESLGYHATIQRPSTEALP
jgi:transposase